MIVMTSLYRYLFGSSSSSSSTMNNQRNNRQRNNNANASQATTEPPSSGSLRIQTQFPDDHVDAAAPSETTSLLSSSATAANGSSSNHHHHVSPDEVDHEAAKPLFRTAAEQSATDFYFPANNPSIQRYYRFTSTSIIFIRHICLFI